MKILHRIALVLTLVLLAVNLTACGSNSQTGTAGDKNEVAAGEKVLLTVGATAVPHAEILELVKPALAEEGIDLKIQEFSDYTQLNPALVEGELDANYFQHIPYLESFNEKTGSDLVHVASVHVEPMGLYSEKIAKLQDLRNGATVAIPNDPTNGGRALLLLQSAGLITLKNDAGIEATPLDIAENPKNLKFHELDAASLPRTLGEVDLAAINTNYALKADLIPTKDALYIEDKNSPYVNVLVVRATDKDNGNLKRLAEALNTSAVKEFIENTYQGAVVPAF